MFGIDIASDDWVSQLISLNEVSARVDIEQGVELLKVGNQLLPEAPGEEEEDPLLKAFFGG